METLIAEDLLLLLIDDDTGKQHASSYAEILLGGALLVDLAAGGHVQLQPSASPLRTGDDVVPTPGSDPVDPVLQRALAEVAEKPRAAKDLVPTLGKGVQEPLLERLAERGILERTDDKVLGLFPRTRWPAADSGHEEDVRRQIGRALVENERPEARPAALIALLHGADQLGVVDTGDARTKDVKARAKQIAEGDWAGDAVGQAVQDVINVVMMTVLTTTVITTSAATMT